MQVPTIDSQVNYLEILGILLNSGLLLIAWRIIRHLTHMEHKVDLMWEPFKRKFLGDFANESESVQSRKKRY